jgi:hypothetical protein
VEQAANNVILSGMFGYWIGWKPAALAGLIVGLTYRHVSGASARTLLSAAVGATVSCFMLYDWRLLAIPWAWISLLEVASVGALAAVVCTGVAFAIMRLDLDP